MNKTLRLGLVLSASLMGCGSSVPRVELRGSTFQVEVVDTPASQARGLMFRESLPQTSGMLFVFDEAIPRSFWMHNCKIALDILYFDAQKKLVSQALSVPPCSLPPEQCPNYPSGMPAMYVLELNAGVAERLGVELGDPLSIELQ